MQQAKNQQWVEAAQKSIGNFNQQWEKLKGVEGFNAFETVLKQLLKNDVTTDEIVEVIDVIIKSPDIRRLVFLTAHGADVNCYTQLLTIFNAAQALSRFGKLLNENASQSEILALAKSMAKQSMLDEATLPIMRHQWSEGRRASNGEGTGPNFNEALKVQLALRHQLAAQLGLPFPIKNPMSAINIAELSQSDEEFAIAFVNKHLSDQEEIVHALVSLPVWQFYLKRLLGEKIIQSDLDESQQIALDELLYEETKKIVHAG